MWRWAWIWQTYCRVIVTSMALGLVTTIVWCSASAPSSCLSQAGRERAISATRRAGIGAAFMEFFRRWLPVGSYPGARPGDARIGRGLALRERIDPHSATHPAVVAWYSFPLPRAERGECPSRH